MRRGRGTTEAGYESTSCWPRWNLRPRPIKPPPYKEDGAIIKYCCFFRGCPLYLDPLYLVMLRELQSVLFIKSSCLFFNPVYSGMLRRKMALGTAIAIVFRGLRGAGRFFTLRGGFRASRKGGAPAHQKIVRHRGKNFFDPF